ncbi:MAG: VWA domain-containing protein [bacterium]
MTFEWPLMFLSLLLVPALVAGYLALLQRRAKQSAALGTMGIAQSSSQKRLSWRRHVPPAIFLAAIALLLASLARPQVGGLPHREGTVILAFDVSSSMRAKDVEPTRMEAAKAAALAFVGKQPASIQIGLVAFGDGGIAVQRPTNVKEDVEAAINRLTPEGGTSLGEGMIASIEAISGKQITLDDAALQGDLEGVDIGYFGSAAVVLLSDGENTSRFDPLVVAQLATNAGIRMFPIGLGKPEGTTVEIDGYEVATSLNEELLQEIAKVTGGVYYVAADSDGLAKVYDSIDLKLSVKGDPREVTALGAAAAAIVMMIGAGFSILWLGRVP